MKKLLTALIGLAALVPAAEARGPIIDVHKHASWPGSHDAEYRSELLQEMDDSGVAMALLHITEMNDIEPWVEAAPGRFIAGPMFPCPRNLADPLYRCFPQTQGWPDLKWLEAELAAGRIGLLGEIIYVYAGVTPDDPMMRPYWQLAANYDVPVAVHINRGPPPGAPNSLRSDPNCCPRYNEELGNPELLRPILERHPDLRLILFHVGAGRAPDHLPFHEETLSILRDFPSVYLEMSILNGVAPHEVHEAELKRLVDAGLEDRIMFGTDNIPTARIVERLEAIAWLTPQQRRGIYYDNAARFLRLDAQTIARHKREFATR